VVRSSSPGSTGTKNPCRQVTGGLLKTCGTIVSFVRNYSRANCLLAHGVAWYNRGLMLDLTSFLAMSSTCQRRAHGSVSGSGAVVPIQRSRANPHRSSSIRSNFQQALFLAYSLTTRDKLSGEFPAALTEGESRGWPAGSVFAQLGYERIQIVCAGSRKLLPRTAIGFPLVSAITYRPNAFVAKD